jgi:NhaP-type Na+/H+ and K+/H+ antiporter
VSIDRQAPPGAVLGAILIFIGLAFLAVRYLDVFQGADVWPLFIIGPGVALLFLPNLGMIVGGSVVSTVGLVLAWQNMTGRWESWAYAWALVGPTASGVGTFLGGLRTGNPRLRDAGMWQIAVGLALFAGFYLFFEQVIGLSGDPLPLPEWVMPALLIGIGVLILLRGLFGSRDSEGPQEPDTST